MMQTETKQAVWRFLIRWIVPAFALMFIFGGPFEQLLLGWIYFPIRVLPRVTADIPTAILGVLCTVLFVGLLHRTLQWFMQQSMLVNLTPKRWAIRSTLAVFGIVVLSFASGTAMVGASHHFVWIMTGRASRSAEDASSLARIVTIADLIRGARSNAQMSLQKWHMKSMGFSTLGASSFTGAGLPPGGLMDEEGTLLHGWPIFLSDNLGFYFPQGLDLDKPWNQPPNDKYFKCQLNPFINPAQPGPYFDDNGFGLIHVAANLRVMPMRTLLKHPDSSRRSSTYDYHKQIKETPQTFTSNDIVDGTSNTVLIGTVGQRFKPWGHPANIRDPALGMNRSPDGFGGPPHWKGGMFTMCDGSVRFISDKTDLKVMHAIATPNGGEPSTGTDQAQY